MHSLGLRDYEIVDHVRLIGLPVYYVINILWHRLELRTHNIGNQKLCKRQNKEYREYNTDTSGVTKCKQHGKNDRSNHDRKDQRHKQLSFFVIINIAILAFFFLFHCNKSVLYFRYIKLFSV